MSLTDPCGINFGISFDGDSGTGACAGICLCVSSREEIYTTSFTNNQLFVVESVVDNNIAFNNLNKTITGNCSIESTVIRDNDFAVVGHAAFGSDRTAIQNNSTAVGQNTAVAGGAVIQGDVQSTAIDIESTIFANAGIVFGNINRTSRVDINSTVIPNLQQILARVGVIQLNAAVNIDSTAAKSLQITGFQRAAVSNSKLTGYGIFIKSKTAVFDRDLRSNDFTAVGNSHSTVGIDIDVQCAGSSLHSTVDNHIAAFIGAGDITHAQGTVVISTDSQFVGVESCAFSNGQSGIVDNLGDIGADNTVVELAVAGNGNFAVEFSIGNNLSGNFNLSGSDGGVFDCAVNSTVAGDGDSVGSCGTGCDNHVLGFGSTDVTDQSVHAVVGNNDFFGIQLNVGVSVILDNNVVSGSDLGGKFFSVGIISAVQNALGFAFNCSVGDFGAVESIDFAGNSQFFAVIQGNSLGNDFALKGVLFILVEIKVSLSFSGIDIDIAFLNHGKTFLALHGNLGKHIFGSIVVFEIDQLAALNETIKQGDFDFTCAGKSFKAQFAGAIHSDFFAAGNVKSDNIQF